MHSPALQNTLSCLAMRQYSAMHSPVLPYELVFCHKCSFSLPHDTLLSHTHHLIQTQARHMLSQPYLPLLSVSMPSSVPSFPSFASTPPINVMLTPHTRSGKKATPSTEPLPSWRDGLHETPTQKHLSLSLSLSQRSFTTHFLYSASYSLIHPSRLHLPFTHPPAIDRHAPVCTLCPALTHVAFAPFLPSFSFFFPTDLFDLSGFYWLLSYRSISLKYLVLSLKLLSLLSFPSLSYRDIEVYPISLPPSLPTPLIPIHLS